MLTDHSRDVRPALRAQVLAPDSAFERYFPGFDTVVIGRDPDCTLQLPSPVVSRHHLTVRAGADGIAVTDHSANGTCVDGELVRGTSRNYGPHLTLQCGPFVVRLSVHEPVPPVERPARALDVPLSLRRTIREQLCSEIGDDRGEGARADALLRERIDTALARLCVVYESELPQGDERDRFLTLMRDETLGFGALEPLLRDPECTEIMVVDAATIYAERAGRWSLSEARFTDDGAVREALGRLLSPLGLAIDASRPLLDVRLADGSRLQAVLPPLAVRGPYVSVRKCPVQQLTLPQLLAADALDQPMAQLLAAAIAGKINLVVSGAAGTGKTAWLHALCALIPEGERIVTVEQVSELKLQQRHVLAFEARSQPTDDGDAMTLREVLDTALQMRPSRLIVGETGGAEVLAMLQAMNTGYDGLLTTVQAHDAPGALRQLARGCALAGVGLSLSAIRRQVAASIQMVVQLQRCADGRRRVDSVSEVAGLDERDQVALRPIFERVREAEPRVDGSTGFRQVAPLPAAWSRFRAHASLATP